MSGTVISTRCRPTEMPACVDALRCSGALALAEQLVAPLRLENAINHVQVVVNYPKFSHWPGGPHIDCHGGQGDPYSFTVLAGIYLCDESAPARGNLHVWPGSHRAHARLFHERGVDVLQQTSGHSTLLDPPLVLEPSKPVLAKRGDIVLAHFLTGHNSSGNETDQMRKIIYFRLSAEGHRDRWRETFLDPLTEYEPLRRFDLGEEAEVVGRERAG